jgi:hypothetical protein
MLQDILTCLGFVLAIIAFIMSYYFARRALSLKNSLEHVTSIAQGLKSETMVMSETSSVASLEVTNLTRLNNELSFKLDSYAKKSIQLESELDEKASFMIQIQASWEKERATLQDTISAQKQGIQTLETHLTELERENAQLLIAKNRYTTTKPLLDRQHPSRNSEKLNMLATSPSKAGPTLKNKQKIDFNAIKAQLFAFFQTSQQKNSKLTKLAATSLLPEAKQELQQTYQAKLDHLKLVARTFKGQKEMLEERNRNWEVALRYFSEYILGSRVKNSANINIGTLVGEALETLNKSLIMNDLLDDKNDPNDALSELSELMQSEGSQPFDSLNSRH